MLPVNLLGTCTNSSITYVVYADDIALHVHCVGYIQHKLGILIFYKEQVGLKKNAAKTKLLRVNERVACNIQVDGQRFEEVSELSYLGSVMSTDEVCRSLSNTTTIKRGRGIFAVFKVIILRPSTDCHPMFWLSKIAHLVT